ncbi:beta-ketoacyl synthase [Solihabitans fulvus]|uniref:Beta-ketoacyl synthase n=1 Tax=Solihabitans fulvus TaxID=1892852 RepID=A0A5B2WUT6_9PSEU|nr:beta-ketoacyl synthase N-terminal-like domain-containing protein [Solihabitans fulvus]KAA2254452.1 beta-ketoacyl synthase [Solihabitans fulvus]
MTVAVTGYATHVPGLSARDLPGSPAEPAVAADQAHVVLGRKGLLAKEPATRLALCAVHAALGLPPGRPTGPVAGAGTTAVVVSSNLGNVQTVCAVVDEMRASSGHAVSPLLAPNASSNIIASSIAIRYGITGPNFMLCAGATSGLDAVRLGARLLRAGRTDRAVVVGVEPDDEIARGLLGLRATPPGGFSEPRAAAACVLLTRYDPAAEGPAVLLDRVTRSARPPEGAAGLRLDPHPGLGGVSLTERVGETYGALGVLQVAAATGWLLDPASTHTAAEVTCGDPEDGYATARLSLTAASQDWLAPTAEVIFR